MIPSENDISTQKIHRNSEDTVKKAEPLHGEKLTKQKLLQVLGLAKRARLLAVGSDMAMAAIQRGKAHCVLLATDVGMNARKKYRDKCAFYHINLLEIVNQQEIGQACGRPKCVVVAVTDPGFAAKIASLAGNSDGGEAIDKTESL